MHNFVIFDIFDNDMHGIGQMSWMNMSKWVLKEPSGPPPRNQMPSYIFLARATVGALALWITSSVSQYVSLFPKIF